MRPTLRLLNDGLLEKIISEARELLATLGVGIHNKAVLELLAAHGATVDFEKWHVRIPGNVIDKALSTVPHSFKLYDVLGNETHDFSGNSVYFTPGSTALNILDGATGEVRRPVTADYVNYAKLASGLKHIASQSCAWRTVSSPNGEGHICFSRSRLVV